MTGGFFSFVANGVFGIGHSKLDSVFNQSCLGKAITGNEKAQSGFSLCIGNIKGLFRSGFRPYLGSFSSETSPKEVSNNTVIPFQSNKEYPFCLTGLKKVILPKTTIDVSYNGCVGIDT
jgi:hypothetical protein